MLKHFLYKIRLSTWFIRLRSWEYWPLHMVYAPVYIYYLLLAIKARNFLFFSAANPGIEMGGLIGESKMSILKKVPSKYLPKTIFLPKEWALEEIEQQRIQHQISFPIILKPNIGERGFLVEKIPDVKALINYRKRFPIDLILQEYIGYPEEVSVLYYRFPHKQYGCITSVTLKKYLSVTGNGRSSLRELILEYPRAKLQLRKLEKDNCLQLEAIPPKGEKVELVPIGNHSRGTTFYNGNHLIDNQLTHTFDCISKELDGIYFGRFDIKCQSFEDLREGKNFSILEINGVKSEPTHIYEPGFSMLMAYKVLFKQWKIIYRLSMINRERGVDTVPLREGLTRVKENFKYKKIARS